MIRVSATGSSQHTIVKLQSETWELNIHGARADFQHLRDIDGTDWSARRTLAIGTCAGAPVHWSAVDEAVSVLIGEDDESWDLGMLIPRAAFEDLLRATAGA